jgi:acyl-CoA reductase-like NAD-dependent aldehyde dehydrogenase
MAVLTSSLELSLVLLPPSTLLTFSLIAINTVLPALLAGNAVILKPSPQTPLVSSRFIEFYTKAGIPLRPHTALTTGLPEGLLQAIHLGTLDELEDLCKRKEIVHIAFTGSVAGGLAVQKAAINSENPFKSIPPLFPLFPFSFSPLSSPSPLPPSPCSF